MNSSARTGKASRSNFRMLTVDLFFERELKDGPEGLAEATVLWIGEPDHSEHELGLFSDRTLEGLRQADREFGRVLDWWETQGRAKDIQLVVMSDHGHVEVARHADFEEILENAGLHVLTGSDIARGAEPRADDVILIGEYTSGIWVPGKKRETLEAVRDALMNSPEVGMVFSQPDPDRPDAREGLIPGTFSEGLLSSAHPRGPDLRVIPPEGRPRNRALRHDECAGARERRARRAPAAGNACASRDSGEPLPRLRTPSGTRDA